MLPMISSNVREKFARKEERISGLMVGRSSRIFRFSPLYLCTCIRIFFTAGCPRKPGSAFSRALTSVMNGADLEAVHAEIPLLVMGPDKGKGLHAEEPLHEDGKEKHGKRLFLRTHVVGGKGLVTGRLQGDEDRSKQGPLELDDALLHGMAQRVRRGPHLVRRHGERVQQGMQIVGLFPQLDPVSADPLFQVRHPGLL